MAQDFLARMKARGKQCVENANEIVRKAALSVDSQVVTATPIDTGRLRSNWLVSLNAPITVVREAYSPGKGGSTDGANTAAAIAQANQVISTRQPGQDIWISNSLGYAAFVNNGTSRQAARNFVETGIQNGIAELRRLKLLD